MYSDEIIMSKGKERISIIKIYKYINIIQYINTLQYTNHYNI